MISVSQNTNCRTGPDTSFLFKGVLQVGEKAQIFGRSTTADYWYIANPDRPGEFCWLWGGFATVDGDVTFTPIYTPAPTPTPNVGFQLFLHSLQTCGPSTHLVLIVQNVGGQAFMTARTQVFNVDAGVPILKPTYDRHPFAPGPADCPPGHGNWLPPGEGAYISVILANVPSGANAVATVMLCTGDHLGGDCLSQDMHFVMPEAP